MSEINQDKTSPALGSLESLLLGSINANHDSAQDSESDDFSRLQEMLVDPEVLRMRERMSNVEQYIPEIEKLRERVDLIEKEFVNQDFDDLLEIREKLEEIENNVKKLELDMDNPKDIIKLFLPIMSKIMNRQLNEFKKEIVQALVPIIKESQEDKESYRKLSIRVVGVNPETEDNLNN